MQRTITVASLVLGMVLAGHAGSDPSPNPVPIRLFLSEVQAGSLQSQQYCALVFTDHHFHYEKASRHHGKDVNRKVYEGEFSEAEWKALETALENKEFRELHVPQEVPPLVMEESHVFTISVGRDANFQNMEFLDNKGRKPYESQLKPLLEWWKSFRGGRLTESKAPPHARCSLDNSHAIFSQ